MDQRVLIMLAAYNGEKYIGKQIESIIAQDYTNWHLVIQDDGSKDNTASIVKEYCKKDNRISYIVNETDKHGPFYNFHVLLNKTKNNNPDYDFYMYSDQDDIWLKNKLSIMIKEFKNKSLPQLVYADMQLMDENDNITNSSVNKVMGIQHTNNYRPFFAHKVYGCNLMMNKILFQLVPPLDINHRYASNMSHDNLYVKFAAIYGKIIYIPTPTMNYRRHSSNYTVNQQYDFSLKKVINRIFGFSKLSDAHANTYNQTLVAIEMMRSIGCTDKILDEIEQCIKKGGINGYKFIRTHKITWGTKMSNISRTATMITGSYKKYLI